MFVFTLYNAICFKIQSSNIEMLPPPLVKLLNSLTHKHMNSLPCYCLNLQGWGRSTPPLMRKSNFPCPSLSLQGWVNKRVEKPVHLPGWGRVWPHRRATCGRRRGRREHSPGDPDLVDRTNAPPAVPEHTCSKTNIIVDTPAPRRES